MTKNKRIVGFIFGILAAITINLLPLRGISPQGKMSLGLTLMTVLFWTFQTVQSGYASGLYLVLLIIFKVAEPSVVFSPFLSSTIYLVIGAYLIASAVKLSGLGERIAYAFIIKFVHSYKSIIYSIFMLTFILSIIIPHPWPRAFIIMSVMDVVIKSANIASGDKSKIGFAVFAAAVPISMIFLTGDSVINPLTVQASGESISYIQWFIFMGPPNIIASILTCALILILFKPTSEVKINKAEIKNKLITLGALSKIEKRTVVWLIIAVVLWMTDFIHGIEIGWITFLIAMLMSFPVIGAVLSPKQWQEVPINVLLFLGAAMAISKVGSVTGMNQWIAETVLPSYVPSNPYLLAIIIASISIILHMILGSVVAVLGIAVPALLIFTLPIGINPVVTTLLVCTSISTHYILPFHHLNLLVGLGDENGYYGQEEVIRLGIPLTLVVFIVVIFEVFYWKLIGLF